MENTDPKYIDLLLCDNYTFTALTDKEKEILIGGLSYSDYERNQIIFKEGDKPAGLLFLCKGKAKVFKEGVGGRANITRMLKPLDIIDYCAIFTDGNYISSALTIEVSTVATIERATLFNLLRSNCELAINIIKLMAKELDFSVSRTTALTQKHTRGRIAESLLFMKDTYGFEEDGATVKGYLYREDLANLSNATTSNVIRTLSAFIGEKIIAVNGRKIKVLDLKKLERISDIG